MLRLVKSLFHSIVTAIQHDSELERVLATNPRLRRFLARRFSSEPSGLWLTIGTGISLLLLFFFFLVVEDLLSRDPLIEADLRIVSLIQLFRVPSLDRAMILITYLGNWQVVLVGSALFIAYLAVLRRWSWIAALCISVLGAQLVVWAVKSLFQRPRPDLTNALVPAHGPSFPSGHAFVAFAFYGLLAWFAIEASTSRWLKAVIGMVALVVVAILGFSRIYVGVHWPSDVLASYALGAAWLTAVATIFGVHRRRSNHSELPKPYVGTHFLAALLFATWFVFTGAFYLVHPIAIGQHAAPPTVVLPEANFPNNLIAAGPQFSEDIVGKAIEPINVIIVGSEHDVLRAFDEAGWKPTDPIAFGTAWRLFVAEVLDQPYDRAPGTPTFWRGRPNERGFEKPTATNSARERHHLHIWATEFIEAGRPVWVGTVHLDRSVTALVGITLPIHQIDPAIDRERDTLATDFLGSGCLEHSGIARVTDPMMGENTLNNPFFTDGKALFLSLRCPP